MSTSPSSTASGSRTRTSNTLPRGRTSQHNGETSVSDTKLEPASSAPVKLSFLDAEPSRTMATSGSAMKKSKKTTKKKTDDDDGVVVSKKTKKKKSAAAAAAAALPSSSAGAGNTANAASGSGGGSKAHVSSSSADVSSNPKQKKSSSSSSSSRRRPPSAASATGSANAASGSTSDTSSKRNGAASGGDNGHFFTSLEKKHKERSAAASVNATGEVWDLKMLMDEGWRHGTVLESVLRGASVCPRDDRLQEGIGGGATALPVFEQAEAVVEGTATASDALRRMELQLERLITNAKNEMQSREEQHEADAKSVEASLPDCFQTFNALDKRVGLVARTAAEVGDRLQTADTVHRNALETISLIEALQQLTWPGGSSSDGDAAVGANLPDIIKDESRPTEAAAMIEKLKQICEAPSTSTGPSQALSLLSGSTGNKSDKPVVIMKALENLRHCSNELENRLLQRFDEATEEMNLATMRMCATSLAQFSGGSSLMKRFVMGRRIFCSVDHNLERALESDEATLARALASLFREFREQIAEDARVVRAVFVDTATANQVMEMYVERVIEQRVASVVESIAAPPPEDERDMARVRRYLRVLDDAYRRTEDFGRHVKEVGCGSFDVQGSIDALFGHVRDTYIPFENNLLVDIMDHEFGTGRAGDADGPSSPATKAAAKPRQLDRVLRATKEAISRCDNLFNSLQVGHVVASLYETLVIGISRAISKSIDLNIDAASGASGADGASNGLDDNGDAGANGGDDDRTEELDIMAQHTAKCTRVVDLFQSCLVRVRVATSGYKQVYLFYTRHVKPKVYNLTSAMMRCHSVLRTNSEEAEAKILSAFEELLALFVHEAESLLGALQLPSDFLPDMNDETSAFLSNTSTLACRTLLIHLLDPVYRIVHGALEGENRETFLVEMATRLQHILLRHITKFSFSAAGGLQLKRDVVEYQEFVNKFTLALTDKASDASGGASGGADDVNGADSPGSVPVVGGVVTTVGSATVIKKFAMLASLVNVFIVAPDSLSSLVEGQLKMNRKDIMRYVALRADYKTERKSLSASLREK